MEELKAFLLQIFVVAIYFIPTIIGSNKKTAKEIFLLNLILGWTMIGWVYALKWAMEGVVREASGYEYEDEYEDKKVGRVRKSIPQHIKDAVWNRDDGKCRQCGSRHKIEFDHIIPWSKGGADTYRNLQLLCEPCNRSKSDKI